MIGYSLPNSDGGLPGSGQGPWNSGFNLPNSERRPPGTIFSPLRWKFAPPDSIFPPLRWKFAPPGSNFSPLRRNFAPLSSNFPNYYLSCKKDIRRRQENYFSNSIYLRSAGEPGFQIIVNYIGSGYSCFAGSFKVIVKMKRRDISLASGEQHAVVHQTGKLLKRCKQFL